MPSGPSSQAHLDVLARQLGFHDYATYQAYQQKQALARGQNGINGTGMAQGQQPAPQNWLQHLLSSVPGTPAYLFGYVNDKMGQALGNGQ